MTDKLRCWLFRVTLLERDLAKVQRDVEKARGELADAKKVTELLPTLHADAQVIQNLVQELETTHSRVGALETELAKLDANNPGRVEVRICPDGTTTAHHSKPINNYELPPCTGTRLRENFICSKGLDPFLMNHCIDHRVDCQHCVLLLCMLCLFCVASHNPDNL